MSKILTNDEVAALRGERAQFNDEMMEALGAGNMGAAQRLAKRVAGIQRQLDDDVSERSRTGYDDARNKAHGIVAGASGGIMSGGPSRDELRALVTPGSSTKHLWVAPPSEQVMGRASQFAQRSGTAYLTTDTATVGSGYFFLPELYRQVTMSLLEASGVLEADPTLIVTNHLRDIQCPTLEADAVATAGTEGSAATETNTEGGVVTLGHYRYDGVFKVPIEMSMSAEYNLDSLLSTFAARAVANQVAAQLALGDGTTEPLGLFTASAVTVGKTCTSATSPTVDNVLEMTKALPKGYRKTARHVWSDVLHTAMLQFKNGDGDYMLRSVESGGYEFGGKSVSVDPWADQSGMSANEIHAVYGDFAGLAVRTTPMLFQRRDDDVLNPTYTFALWMDAKVLDANALVSLKMGS